MSFVVFCSKASRSDLRVYFTTHSPGKAVLFQGRAALTGSVFCCEPGKALKLSRRSSQTPSDGKREEGINGFIHSPAVLSALCKCFSQFGEDLFTYISGVQEDDTVIIT